jgi:hypothetical protein
VRLLADVGAARIDAEATWGAIGRVGAEKSPARAADRRGNVAALHNAG